MNRAPRGLADWCLQGYCLDIGTAADLLELGSLDCMGSCPGPRSMRFIRVVRIQRTITIERSPEDVWAFIADARNDPQWCHKVVSVEQVAGDGPGPGAKYKVLHSPRPFKPPVELSMDVVEYEQPRRLGCREEDGDGVYNVVYELEPIADGTRLTQIDDIEWKISKLAFPIARMMVSRDLNRQFSSLKHLLEE